MKVYTERSDSGLVVLLRRVGTTVGFLFGFGLLALIMAGNASADDQQGSERALLGVVDSVTDVVEPAVRAGTDVLAPVVRPVTDIVEPIVEPITAPVLRPVVSTVSPVLDAVTPVTEPVLGPLLNAADPVVEPISEAAGLPDAVPGIANRSETTMPQGRAQPVPALSRVVTPSPSVLPEVIRSSDTPDRPHWDGGHESAATADSERLTGPANPADAPGAPIGPVNAAPGGSGSVGGSGGSHSADAAVSLPGFSLADNNSSGRSPPGAIAGNPWFGYDRPDCPS